MSKGSLPPPADLGQDGSALWASVVADVPADLELDARELVMLAQACRAVDHLVALEAVIDAEGVTATGSKGQPIVHPAVAEVRQQRLVVLRLLGAIGLEERSAERPAASPAQLRGRRAADARWQRQDRVRLRREKAS